jgi:alkylation response protein AidB-like acyl-CoA dehydrogenase
MVALDAPPAVQRAAALAPQFAGRAAEHDREASFPFENFTALQEAGLLRLPIPVEFGGDGADLATACRVVEHVARGDASTALVLAMHYIHHTLVARRGRWPAAIHERVCRDAIENGAMLNTVRVEPELGTPARGGLPATVARRTADGWCLSGHKLYATGSPILAYFIVLARTDEPEPRLGNFLVPRGTPGVRIVETWDHLGMRATGSHDMLLEDALLPAEYGVDVRPPAEWAGADPTTAGWNNLVLSAVYHGIAVAAFDWLTAYLNERVPTNLGAPLASLPRMQSAVGEMRTLLYSSERLIYGLAADLDRGSAGVDAMTQTSMVKSVATNNAVKAVDVALSLVGNPGLSRTRALERHHRDVLCSRIHTPQDDTILLMAGKAALGL